MVKKPETDSVQKHKIVNIDFEELNSSNDLNDIHKLQVHQVELEMQNEQLLKSQIELEKSQRRYYDLYNYAPVGYISIDKNGFIIDANFTAFNMLGYDINYLKKRQFEHFISPEKRLNFHKIFKNVLSSVFEPQCEMEILTADNNLNVLLEIVPIPDEGEVKEVLVAILDVTDRKETENKLVKSEERFRKSFLDSVIAMALIGEDNKFICANKQLCELLGYSEQELINKTFFDITHPADLAKSEEFAQKLLNGKLSNCEMEKRYLAKDGTTIWAYISLSVINDYDGSPSHIMVQIQDITDYRKIQHKIKFKANALSQISDAVVSLDNKKRVTFWNKAAEKLYGIKEDEIIGKPLNKAFEYEMVFKKGEDPMKILKSQGNWTGESIHITPDGKKLNVESSITVLKKDHGEKMGYLAVIRDETYRKKIEDALEKSEEKYRTMLDTMKAGIWLSDENMNTLHVNSNMARMMGYAKPELIHRNILDFVDKKDRKRLIRYMKRRSEGLSDNYEIKLKCKDGSDLWLLVAASPLMVNGKFLGSLRVMTDISTRKNVESQIKESHVEKMKYLRLVMDSVMALTRYSMEKESDGIDPDHFT